MRQASLARRGINGTLAALLVVPALLMAPARPSAGAAGFDFDNGNAALSVIVPAFLPTLREFSPGDSDAPVILRITTLLSNAAFDAIAPYHPTAVGIYSRLGRRPAAEA